MHSTSPRNVGRKYFLDANCLNANQRNVHIGQLEKWNADGVITIFMSRVAATEAAVGSRVRHGKTYDYTKVFECAPESGNDEMRMAIERLVFSNGAANQNKKNDIEILYMAERLGYPLVTRDGASRTQRGGMLGNAEALRRIGVYVLSPEQAVEEIRQLIAARDDALRQSSKATGKALPCWVGLDSCD